jgi:hypothetical protein
MILCAIYMCYRKIGGPSVGIYKSLTETWMWKLGLRLGIHKSDFLCRVYVNGSASILASLTFLYACLSAYPNRLAFSPVTIQITYVKEGHFYSVASILTSKSLCCSGSSTSGRIRISVLQTQATSPLFCIRIVSKAWQSAPWRRTVCNCRHLQEDKL